MSYLKHINPANMAYVIVLPFVVQRDYMYHSNRLMENKYTKCQCESC
jgi:hypothetical protein